MQGADVHPGAKHLVKMRDIAKPAVEADGGDGIIGLDQLPDGVVQPVLYYRLHECFPGDLAKIAAEGIGGHTGDGGCFFQGDGAPEVLHEISEDGMDPFPVRGGKPGRDATRVQQDGVLFRRQFLQQLKQADETAEIIGFGRQGMDTLYGRGAEETGAAGWELDPAMGGMEQALDQGQFGARKKILTQAIGGKLNDDGLGGGVGRGQFPAMGEVGSQQDEVARGKAGHVAADVPLTTTGGDQGQLIFGMEMEGCPEAIFVKRGDEKGVTL